MSAPIGPGDFVECVDAGVKYWNDRHSGIALAQLVNGAVYVVTGIGASTAEGGTIFLAGIWAAYQADGFGWATERFRPIYRPKQSLIRDLLQPVKEDA